MTATCDHRIWDTPNGFVCYLAPGHVGVHQYRHGSYLPDRHDKPGRGDGE